LSLCAPLYRHQLIRISLYVALLTRFVMAAMFGLAADIDI